MFDDKHAAFASVYYLMRNEVSDCTLTATWKRLTPGQHFANKHSNASRLKIIKGFNHIYL
jgi:hypothetical protein